MGNVQSKTQLPQFPLVPRLNMEMEFYFGEHCYVTSCTYKTVKDGGFNITELH